MTLLGYDGKNNFDSVPAVLCWNVSAAGGGKGRLAQVEWLYRTLNTWDLNLTYLYFTLRQVRDR